MKKYLTILIIAMLAVTGILFTGCGYSYKDIEITASYENIADGYMTMTVGQESIVTFTLSNLPKNASARLTFSKDANIISTPEIVQVNQLSNTNTVKIRALSHGEVLLRAYAEGGNFYELKIKIILAVTDFSLKEDITLFAVRGENNPKKLELTSNMFNFYPAQTSQKEITFKDSNGNILTEIDANEYQTQNQIAIYAQSPYLSKRVEVRISIIDEIANVKTYDFTQDEPILLISEEEETESQAQSQILFVTNRSEFSRKTLKLIVENNTNPLLRVTRQIIQKNVLQCSEFDILKTYLENGNTIFEFELQSLQDGQTQIQFSVFYLGYETYEVTRTFDVLIKNAPDEIRINDLKQSENIVQTLFDGAYSTVVTTQYISIIPSNSMIDRIEIDYDLSAITTLQNPNPVMSEYISFKENDFPIGDSIENLNNPIIAKGIKSTSGNVIYLIIKVFWGDEYSIIHNEGYKEYRLGFEVKSGANGLLIDEEFSQSDGIYLENNGEEQIFNGIYVTKVEAYTDNMTIISISQGAGLYAKVEQNGNTFVQDGKKFIPIKITPLSVGSGKWRLILPNGVYKDLTINVIVSVNSLKLDYDESNSSMVSKKVYTNDSLTSIGVKLTETENNYSAYLQLKFTTNPINFNFLNTKLYTFTKAVTNESPGVSSLTNVTFNSQSNILSIVTDVNGFSEEVFAYRLEVKKANNFKLISLADLQEGTEEYEKYLEENVFEGKLNVNAYLPLTSVNFSQNEVSLYSYSHLGINYKTLASKVINLTFTPNEISSLFASLPLNSNDISVSYTSSISSSFSNGILYITDYGTYDVNLGTLTLDVYSSVYEPFYIYANLTYYGELFTASLKVIPQFYQSVTGVRLSNYLNETEYRNSTYPYIYLDPSHSYQDIYTYVVPQDAIHKDLRYTFEADIGYSSLLVKIETTYNGGIRIVYNNEYENVSNGGSGFLIISPMANIMDPSVVPSNSLKIRINIGAGSYENPFLISTAQELLSIKTSGYDKHYVIETVIDMSNINFTSLGVFSGSIDGKGIGKIVGLNLNTLSQTGETNYGGLFEQIMPLENVENSGVVKNLVIEGSINLVVTSKSSIGLLAGKVAIGAKLINVTSIINQSTISIATTSELKIGGVVGENFGEIVNYIGLNENTDKNFANNSSVVMNGQFTLSYTLQETQNRSYFGGVAGVNEGIISKVTVSNVKLYNKDIYTAYVNMYVTGAKGIQNSAEKLSVSVGAFAGKNTSIITANKIDLSALDNSTYYEYVKAGGIIEVYQANNRLGGLVGENLGLDALVENAISRVKVRSNDNGTATAYVGGLFAYNEQGVVKNCLLQSLEDGTSLGKDVSLIYSSVFGITQGEEPTLDGRVNIYGYDRNLLSINDDENPFVVSNNLISQTYVGALMQNGVIPQGKRNFETDTTVFATLNNYFGDYLVGGKIGRMFSPVDVNLIINAENTKNPMTSENSSLFVAYLFLHKAQNSNEQTMLNNLNTYDLPFDFVGEIGLYSFDSNIVSISSAGKLFVRSTGLVKLRVLSAMNAKISQDVYIYVAYAVDNFSLYIQNVSAENLISVGKVIKIYSNQTLPIMSLYAQSSAVLGGYEIELEAQQDLLLYNEYEYEIGFVKTVELVKIGSIYGLEAVDGKGSTPFEILARFETTINGNLFQSSFIKNKLGNEISHIFTVEHSIGATNSQVSIDEISNEPSDEFDFDILISTDDFDDVGQMQFTRQVSNNLVVGDYFEVNETNRVYTIAMSNSFPQIYLDNVLNGELDLKITQTNTENLGQINQTLTLLFDKTNMKLSFAPSAEFVSNLTLDMSDYFTILAGEKYTYSFEIILTDIGENQEDTLLEGTTFSSYISLLSINYSYTAKYKLANQTNYQGVYYINFAFASNSDLHSTITVNLSSQSIGQILIESFNGSTQSDINAGVEQSSYIDPQSNNPNHFRISVFPNYADYDYIEIVNETTDVSTLLTLIDENGQNKFGAVLISNGIKLTKANVTPYLFVKYASTSIGVMNGQVLTFAVIAYKNGEVVYKATKDVIIRFAKDVTFEIENKQVTDSGVFLARGMSYKYTISSNGYTEDEIFISSSRPDVININNANKTITVTSSNIVYAHDNLQATIEIYGRKNVGGELISSFPFTLNVVIVDYYIIETEDIKIIKEGTNGVVGVGLGNTYTLSTKFLNGSTIEYNSSISTIGQSILSLENTINQSGQWQYQIGSKNSDDTYSFANDWNTITGDILASQTNGYFTIKKSNGNYIFTPLKINSSQNPAYKFRLVFGYDYQNGLAVFSLNAPNIKTQEFVFNIYQISSIQTPTPIFNLQEFMAMNDNSYYILMTDLTLPSTYKPISAKIAGLDGNGYKLIINNNFSVDDDLGNIGIFTTIEENALIRNLTIKIEQTARWTVNQVSSHIIYFGILAGENNGIITNVNIVTKDGAMLKVIFTGTVQTGNYVGGLVGLNNGYITNSNVILSLTTSSNLAGFVAYNTGKISSCYVDNSLIINTSTDLQNRTAGFVVVNSIATTTGGKISNSYVSGKHSKQIVTIYANDTSKIIRASTQVSGFIYENNGEIKNSYSNIPMQTSSKSAGFVFVNKGTITNTYSTSMLKSNSQESYGFVYDNSTGTLSNNYYLTDSDINYSINTSNISMNEKFVKALNKTAFGVQSNFADFVFTSYNEIAKGTWFFPILSYHSQFNNPNKSFTISRPELVSANLISTSKLEIDLSRTSQNEETGEITYFYMNIGAYAQGNIYNPYLIMTALELENKILFSNSSNINTKSYRIVCDIDYESDNVTLSQLYNTVITGDIDGNNMEIRGYVIDSQTKSTSTGLFSKIGNGSQEQGVIRDVTLKPKYINTPNALCVGALAGTLDGGTAFNIIVNGFSYSNQSIVIIGKNIVGGVFGRTINTFKMQNIDSSISTNATYRSPLVLGQNLEYGDKITSYFLLKTHLSNSLSKLSYAGSVVGVASGNGQIINIQTHGIIASIAEFASFAFGGVGDGVVIDKVNVSLVQGAFIQPAVYGGFVSGEFYGQMTNANVSGSKQITGLIRTIPFVPYAVGGLVGLMGSSNNLSSGSFSQLGGMISNSSVVASILLDDVKIVGGLVGELIGGRVEQSLSSGATQTEKDEFVKVIKSSSFSGSLQSKQIVGGIIGKVSVKPLAQISYSTLSLAYGFNNALSTYCLIDNSSVSDGTLKVTSDDFGQGSIGGLIGKISLASFSPSNFKISSSNSKNELILNMDIYGTSLFAYVGGLVGEISKDEIVSGDSVDSSLMILDSQFENRIYITMRDLKYNSADAFVNNSLIYKFHYGKIVANELENFIVDGENISYSSQNEPYYSKSSQTDRDILLFSHINESGQLVAYNQNDNEVKLFNKFELNDEEQSE